METSRTTFGLCQSNWLLFAILAQSRITDLINNEPFADY